MTPEQMYPFRVFGVVMTLLFALAGLAVVLRPEKKIVTPGHRVGNFFMWMLGPKRGMRIIRFLGWIMLIGGAVCFMAALGALMAAG